MTRSMIPGLSAFVICVLSKSAIIATQTDGYEGYYIASPMMNFYMAPQRAVSETGASHILSTNANNCSCRNACFATKCRGWSVGRKADGAVECRLSEEGPGLFPLQNDSSATYFFLQRTPCVVTTTTDPDQLFPYSTDMLEEVATLKTVYSTTPYGSSFEASQANDGSDSTFFSSQNAVNAWWVVDLGVKMTIFHIKILPRQTCCQDRFSEVEVLIGDALRINGNFSSYSRLGLYKGSYTNAQGWVLFSCGGATGRYLAVTIRKAVAEYLEITTLQAYTFNPR